MKHKRAKLTRCFGIVPEKSSHQYSSPPARAGSRILVKEVTAVRSCESQRLPLGILSLGDWRWCLKRAVLIAGKLLDDVMGIAVDGSSATNVLCPPRRAEKEASDEQRV